jgi:hypothetical protein
MVKMVPFPARVPPRVIAALRRYARDKTKPTEAPLPLGVAIDRMLEAGGMYAKYLDDEQ